jgi:DNA-binding FrmR family transcriptional regulator
MAHIVREKTKLLNRVKRIRGQMEAVERALESDIGCTEMLHRLAAVRGSINGLMAKVMEDHIRFHVADPKHASDRKMGGDELIEIVNSYLR